MAGHTPIAPSNPTTPPDTSKGGSIPGLGTNVADQAASDASMASMMESMRHNTIVGNAATVAESLNNLQVNGTGGITKVTSNVGRNLKDAAG